MVGHYLGKLFVDNGTEPESVTLEEYGGTSFVFVGAEQSSIVGVYDITNPATPEPTQLLPSSIGPESYLTLSERSMSVSANENDDAGASPHVMLFEYQDAAASDPHLTSAWKGEITGWGAISGQVIAEDGTMWVSTDNDGVNDHSGEKIIFSISME